MNSVFKNALVWVLLGSALIFIFNNVENASSSKREMISYSQFKQEVLSDRIAKVIYKGDQMTIFGERLDGTRFETRHPIYKRDESVDNAIEEIFLLKSKFNLVISDLAPNLTGIRAVDEENISELNIITLDTALGYLSKSNGSFIIKTFQNSLLKKLRTEMEKSFHLVQTYKPAASKSKSAEIYLYGERPLWILFLKMH